MTTSLTILILNILLPTADIVSDINLGLRLFKPTPRCEYFTFHRNRMDSAYQDCNKDPVTFCSRNETKRFCDFYQPHPKMAMIFLIPCLINYIVCFYTFFRLTTHMKKYLFICPLLNLYPQYGKSLLSWRLNDFNDNFRSC